MILLANKPQGWTSNDLVQYLKHQLKAKKCGHAGTLDPMATGLMIVATNEDTKKLHELTAENKSYTATIDLSATSDTRDKEYRQDFTQYSYNSQGLSIDSIDTPRPDIEKIKYNLQLLYNHAIELPLPPFSAKKINGNKSYDLARQGKQEINYQHMTIYSISIREYIAPLLTLECNVGSGTYIRSIAYRLGKQLNTGGILVSLSRTSIGSYHLNQIISPISGSKIDYHIIE